MYENGNTDGTMIDDSPICAINATNKPKTRRHGIHEKQKNGKIDEPNNGNEIEFLL